MRPGVPAERGTAERVRRLTRTAAAWLATLALAGCGGLGDRDLTIVVISLDTTRPDHLTPYAPGRATTPTLDRLAREGVRFRQARSTAPWTLPAHMSLFTGLPPGLHDVNIDFQVLDRGHPTMGELFQRAGYRTMGVFTGPYVHGHYGFSRGMDFYERATLEPMVWDLPPESVAEQMKTREFLSHVEVTSRQVLDRARHMLRNSTQDKNLLFLHYFDPHYDYLAPAPYVERFADPGYRGPISGKGISGNPALRADMSPADRAQLEALYDAELAYVDESIGQLLAELERQGRLDSTLIVVTADHGEAFFEHGRFGHRRDLSDVVLKVPLLIWGPGLDVPAGLELDEPVSLVDVLPTLLDYAGLPEEPALDGRSLRPLIEGRGGAPRPVTAALTYIPQDPQGYYELHESLVLGTMKVVRTLHVSWSPDRQEDLVGEVLPGSERLAVFDLESDPGETRDLIAAGDPRAEPLIEAFHSERSRQRERLAAFRPQGRPDGGIDLPYDEILRATGYLERAADAPPGGTPAPVPAPEDR